MATIVKVIVRPAMEIVKQFSNIGIATIHESIGKETNNLMDHAIKPICKGMKLIGPAITVDCFPADNVTVHVAMTMGNPGDAVVINGHGIPGVMFGA